MFLKVICFAFLVGISFAKYDYCRAPLPTLTNLEKIALKSKDQQTQSNLTLKRITIIHRHGSRAPANVLPFEDVVWTCPGERSVLVDKFGEPFQNDFYQIQYENHGCFSPRLWKGNCSVGELLEEGREHQHKIGRALRMIYVEKMFFLPLNYSDSSLFYIRSTHVWRARQSSSSLLRGLYPFQNRNPSIPFTPIHVKMSQVEDLDPPNVLNCPKLGNLWGNRFQTPEWISFHQQFQNLSEKLSQILDVSNESAWQLSFDHFFDAFRCRTCNSKPLPCNRLNGSLCVEKEDAEQVFKIGNWETNYLVNDSQVVRLAIGGLWKSIWKQIENDQKSQVKFSEFSAHDGTLLFLLSSLKALDGEWPPYSAHLIFETYVDESNGDEFVLTKYNGQEILIGNCTELLCSSQQFESWISQYFWNDYYSECL